MAYNVKIERAESHGEFPEKGIPYETWRMVAESDPEIRVHSDSRMTIAERWEVDRQDFRHEPSFLETLRPENKHSDEIDFEQAGWLGHPRCSEVELCFSNGTVYAANPDQFTLQKMLQLAEKLGSTVVGEDGEQYRFFGGAIQYYNPEKDEHEWKKMTWDPHTGRAI